MLKQKGIFNSSLIIITSDHGESLYENDNIKGSKRHSDFIDDGSYKGHGYSLYQPEIMVPLIFYHHQYNPVIINKIVRTVDIVPTILDSMNIKKPEYLDGTSLNDLLKNKQFKNNFAYAEIPPSNGKLYCVRKNDWKYITNNEDIHELYDLSIDPTESNNLFEVNKSISSEMQTALNNLNIPEINKQEIDIELRDQLEALGYIDL